jgi:DNA repair protein RadC
LAALDSIVSTDTIADLCSSVIRAEFGVTGARGGTGPVGLSPTGAFGADDIKGPDHSSEDQETEDQEIEDQETEDREILAGLIAPIVFDQANSISEELIRNFGTLPRVFAGIEDGNEAAILPSNVAVHLNALKRLISRLLRRDVSHDPILSTTNELLAYLHNEMACLDRETLRVLFLDASNRLISEKIMWEGTVASVQCHPREIICAALQRGASALILVHNHPSGDPAPSLADIAVTRELNHAASYLGIVLHDHIVISVSGHISMRAEGLMEATGHNDNGHAAGKPDNQPFWMRSLSKLHAR